MKKTKKSVTPVKRRLDRSHTGKLRHHRHTSYVSLALILLLSVVPIFWATQAVASAASFPTPPAVTDQYGVYAVVPGATPGTPSITSLANGASFNNAAPVQIRGRCNDGELIKVFKNEILAGAAYCSNGSYQISIDLFVGNNSLIARAYNANDAVGPDSNTVAVQLQLPGTNLNGINQLNSQGAPAGEFYVTSAVTHRGVAAGDTSVWSLVMVGGQPPYAVSVSWGDGKTDLYSRGSAGQFDVQHTYAKAAASGNYTVIVKATDQAGNKTYLQLATLVKDSNKSGGVLNTIKGGYSGSTVIRMAWQMLAVLALVLAGFWLGERRERKLLRA